MVSDERLKELIRHFGRFPVGETMDCLRELQSLRAEKIRAITCVVCGAELLPEPFIPHCTDCVLSDEHDYAPEERDANS